MHYFPLGRSSTLKAALNGGWFQSPNMFRNELFQVGGYKTLRGFDEESIFASAYGIATAEYRYLIGQNSFLAAFVDYGVSANKSQGLNINNNFLGAGLGMAFETKAGIFNISYAAGKRDDDKFNLRQAKIHIGYVNYLEYGIYLYLMIFKQLIRIHFIVPLCLYLRAYVNYERRNF